MANNRQPHAGPSSRRSAAATRREPEVIDVDSWAEIASRKHDPIVVESDPIAIDSSDDEIVVTSVLIPPRPASSTRPGPSSMGFNSLTTIIDTATPQVHSINYGTKYGPPVRAGGPSAYKSIGRRPRDGAEEVAEVLRVTAPRPPSKKPKVTDLSDPDEEYERGHLGLDISDGRHWKPLPLHEPDVAELPNLFNKLKPPAATIPRRPVIWKHPPARRPIRATEGNYIWDGFRLSNAIPKRKFFRNRLPTDGLRFMASREHSLRYDLHLGQLERQVPPLQAANAINKIAQNSEMIAVCSSTISGGADIDNEEPNPYNRVESLLVQYNGEALTIDGHDRSRPLPRTIGATPSQQTFQKHYTVNDVKFDPRCKTTLVSSGNDQIVRVWSYDEMSVEDVMDLDQLFQYPDVPHDLAFHSTHHVLAVACKDGKIYLHSTLESPNRESLTVAPSHAEHATGAMLWGVEATSTFIYASSEPYEPTNHTGHHKAFDVNRRKSAYDFDACEAGDALALQSSGENLALFTLGDEGAHHLRIYDVRRKSGHAVCSTLLDSFPASLSGDGEVNTAAYSSDGIYLAVARNDNTIHVYDARMLERGVVMAWRHRGPSLSPPGCYPYGVLEIQWMESATRRLGLVSGGNDGCIRLWDAGQAPDNYENGAVLAQADSDISHFSLGKPYSAEKVLIVGDSGGRVSIYERRGGRPLW